LLQFVFRADDHARVVGRIFQVVDNDALYLGAERGHEMAHQIMGEGTLFRNVAHKHGDCAAHRLVDVDDEDLVVVPEKNSAPAARRQNRPDLHLDDRLIHPRKPYQGAWERQGAPLLVIVLVLLLVLDLFSLRSRARAGARLRDE
jgi:hypothetical protein